MSDTPRSVLVVHSSWYGQSTKIARVLSEQLQAAGLATDFQALTSDTAVDPERHCGLILVLSVKRGAFDDNNYDFVERHRAWIESAPTLLMTVSLTARKPEKRDPAVHVYTLRFLERSGWKPGQVEVVAGALEYPRYTPAERLGIKTIMTITGGPTDTSLSIEYTDWEQVRAAGEQYIARLGARAGTVPV